MDYELMHQNDPAASLTIDERTGNLVGVKIKRYEIMPYLGNADLKKCSFG